jgi:hypothetical protein
MSTGCAKATASGLGSSQPRRLGGDCAVLVDESAEALAAPDVLLGSGYCTRAREYQIGGRLVKGSLFSRRGLAASGDAARAALAPRQRSATRAGD